MEAAHSNRAPLEAGETGGVFRTLEWSARYDKDLNDGKASTTLRPYGADGTGDESTKLGKDAEWVKTTFGYGEGSGIAAFTVNDYMVQQSILYLALQLNSVKYVPQISETVTSLYQELTVDMKGNPLAPRFTKSEMVPFTPALRKEMVTMQTKLAAEGERVLGFAEWIVPKSQFEDINLETGVSKGKVLMKIEGEEAKWDIAEENVCGSVNSTAFKQAAFVGMISLQEPKWPPHSAPK